MRNLALLISILTDPKNLYLLFFFYVTVIVHKSVLETIIIGVINIIIFIFLQAKNIADNKNDDYTFGDREVRRTRYVTFISLIIIALFFIVNSFYSTHSFFEMKFFTMLLLITVFLFVIAAIFKFKLSAHIIYMGILLAYFFEIYDRIVIFGVLSLVIGLARIKLKKHTINQLALSFVLIMISYILFDFLFFSNAIF